MKRSLSHSGLLALLALGIALTLGQGDLDPSQQNGALDAENNPQRSMKSLMHGFKVNDNVKAITITTVANGLDGFHCVDGSTGGVWIGVLARDNGRIGIKAGAASTLKDCAAKGNKGIGIMAGEASTLGNCTAVFNQEGGIAIGPRGMIDLCSASSNGLIDIKTDEGCMVVESTAGGGEVGIALGDASRARGCVVSGSTVGLRLGSNSRAITDTMTTGKPGATAIQILGTGNRVESCHLSIPDPDSVGLAAQDPANLFIGLSATGPGTHFSIPQGAAQGPIVSGDEVPQNLSPHANFSF